MSDIRLTNEKMLTFTGHEKIGTFKAAEKLTEFGEKQNIANEALAANVNDLIKRVCAIEDRELKDRDIMRKIADELTAFKRDLDRVAQFINTGKKRSSCLFSVNDLFCHDKFLPENYSTIARMSP